MQYIYTALGVNVNSFEVFTRIITQRFYYIINSKRFFLPCWKLRKRQLIKK